MTLTKADIVKSISSQCGSSKMKSEKIVAGIAEFIEASLESGEDVLLSSFGKFSVNSKDARRGRNPATGDDMTLGARSVVTFRSLPVLRAKINGKRRDSD